MRVVHEGSGTVLASDVAVADSTPARIRGLMFRRSVPEEFALVFPFEDVGHRSVHMLFVPFALDALWLVEGRVEQVKRLRPWIGLGAARADTLIELPAGAAADVAAGDAVRVEGMDGFK